VSGERDLAPDLLWVLDQRYAVEVLDVLATRPATRAALRAAVSAPRAAMSAALRGLAALGAIRRCGQHGSWDLIAPNTVVYELTEAGRALAGQFRRFDVWVAICARHRDDIEGPDQH
jgi:DNA-binding HxlR family transcriptional regulator